MARKELTESIDVITNSMLSANMELNKFTRRELARGLWQAFVRIILLSAKVRKEMFIRVCDSYDYGWFKISFSLDVGNSLEIPPKH